MAKIVDDLIITGNRSVVDSVIKLIDDKFMLVTIVDGPCELRFFGNNIIQNDDYTIATNGEDKHNVIDAYPMSRARRRQINEGINDIEKKSVFI